MTTPFFVDDLVKDEGEKLKAYKDSVGIWTIGVGHAYVRPGTIWTKEQSRHQLAIDIVAATKALDAHLLWWRHLSDARQDVLLNMCFNLGINRLLGFKNTLQAVRLGHYDTAAYNMVQSKWAEQVHGRATRLALQMKTGVRK